MPAENPFPPARKGLSPNPLVLQQVQDERIRQAKFPLIRQLPLFPLILNLLKGGRKIRRASGDILQQVQDERKLEPPPADGRKSRPPFAGKWKIRPLLPWLLSALVLLGIGQFLTAVPVAYAHGGVAPGDNLWAAWNTTNPLPTLGLFLAALLYVNGLGKWDKPSHPINAWQKGSFFAGILALFLALQSPLDPLAEHYFFVHQVQHLLLRMVGPLLVLLGAPLTPMLRGLPLWLRQGAVRPLVRQPWARQGYQYLTNPVAAVALFLVALYFWQVPGLHDLAVRNDYVHEVMHFTMLFSGFLFWWLVIDPKPHRSRLHYGLRVLYLGLIVLPNTVLGAGITFARGLLYQSYAEVEQPIFLDALVDQQLGGLFLWVIGDMMSIIAAGIVMIMWYQREQEKERLEAAGG